MSKAQLEGVYVMGSCVGVVSEAWARNGKSGINWRLGVSRTYADKWGQETTEVIQVDIAAEGVEKLQKQALQLKGKPCMIRVFPIAKVGGRNGAFFTLFAPAESDLLPQPGAAPMASVAPSAPAGVPRSAV